MIRFAQYINAKTAASTQFSEILLVIITESWQHSIIVDLVNLLIQHGADVNIPQKTICSNVCYLLFIYYTIFNIGNFLLLF